MRTMDPHIDVISQLADLCIISLLMIIYRPRKWPEYFTVGLLSAEDESEETTAALIQKFRIIPVNQAKVDDRVLNSNEGSAWDSSEF